MQHRRPEGYGRSAVLQHIPHRAQINSDLQTFQTHDVSPELRAEGSMSFIMSLGTARPCLWDPSGIAITSDITSL